MDDAEREIALRIEGANAPGALRRIQEIVAGVDPGSSCWIDAETGIVHLKTRREVLDMSNALESAGWNASAMTG